MLQNVYRIFILLCFARAYGYGTHHYLSCSKHDKENMYLVFKFFSNEIFNDFDKNNNTIYLQMNQTQDHSVIKRNCTLNSGIKLKCLVPRIDLRQYKISFVKASRDPSIKDTTMWVKHILDVNDFIKCLDHSLKMFEIKMVAEDVLRVSWTLQNVAKIREINIEVDGVRTDKVIHFPTALNYTEDLPGFKQCKRHNICVTRVYDPILIGEKTTCDDINTKCPKQPGRQEESLFDILISVIGGLFGMMFIACFYICVKHKQQNEQENGVDIDQVELLTPPPVSLATHPLYRTRLPINETQPPINGTQPPAIKDYRTSHTYDTTSKQCYSIPPNNMTETLLTDNDTENRLDLTPRERVEKTI